MKKFFIPSFSGLITCFLILLSGGCKTYSEIAEKYLSEEKRRSLKSSARGEEEKDFAEDRYTSSPAQPVLPPSSPQDQALHPDSGAVVVSPQKSEAFLLPEIENNLRKLRGDMEVLNKKLEDSHKMLQTTLQALAQKVHTLEQNQSNSTNKKPSSQEEAQENIFHQAEGFFKNKQWKSAIIYYERFREKAAKTHPLYKKSLLQIGFCFQQLNMHREGKVFLTELVQDFPDSSESLQARGLLSDAPSAKAQKTSD